MIMGSALIALTGFVCVAAIRRTNARWYELAVPTPTCILIAFLFGLVTEHLQTRDIEYWTGYGTSAEYYEPWDETVPCRHPKYRTETYTTTDAQGRVTTQTRLVPDGFEHPYDVDYHPASWHLRDNTGADIVIDRANFDRLCGKFGNRQFVDLKRSYHSIDGDKYVAVYDGSDDRLEVTNHTHSYENRIVAGKSILKPRRLAEGEKEEFALFDYPKLSGYDSRMILGADDHVAERKLQILNARNGKERQIRVWVLVFTDQPLEAGYAQEAYWEGGNKNELLIMVGITKEQEVVWGYVASWSKREDLKLAIRDVIYAQKRLDLGKLIDEVRPTIEANWERREFREFDYIDVEPPFWVLSLNYSLVFTITLTSTILSVYAGGFPVGQLLRDGRQSLLSGIRAAGVRLHPARLHGHLRELWVRLNRRVRG